MIAVTHSNLLTLVIIVSVLELYFLPNCSSSEHCYQVNGRYVCYFEPYGSGVGKVMEEWEEAWKTCRANGATLPSIENSTMQALAAKYVKAELPGVETWTAGRGIRSPKWEWVNGRELKDTELLDNHNYLSPIYDTQAILTNDLKVSGRYPSDKYHYVCQFSGSACKTRDAIPFGDGNCLKYVTNESVRWYDARNLCIENGSDLPIFEDPRLINNTRRVFVHFPDAIGIWIGLRKTWWQWKKIGSMEEAKYTNWLDHDNYVNRECMLLTENGKRWKQQYCRTPKRFFCQAVKTQLHSMEAIKAQTTDSNAEYPHKMSITVGISIPVIIVVAVASVLLVKKCKPRSNSGSDRPRNRSYQARPLTRLNGPTPVTANGHCIDLKPLGGQNAKTQQDGTARHSVHEQIWVERETVDT